MAFLSSTQSNSTGPNNNDVNSFLKFPEVSPFKSSIKS